MSRVFLKHGQNSNTVLLFFVKKCLVPMEIHNKIVNMLENAVPSKVMVCKLAVEFKRGPIHVIVGRLKMISAMDTRCV